MMSTRNWMREITHSAHAVGHEFWRGREPASARLSGLFVAGGWALADSAGVVLRGGAIEPPGTWYRILVGFVLLLAAYKLFFQPRVDISVERMTQTVPWLPGVLAGGLVGLLSGLTGTGGGIFLTPLLLFFGW